MNVNVENKNNNKTCNLIQKPAGHVSKSNNTVVQSGINTSVYNRKSYNNSMKNKQQYIVNKTSKPDDVLVNKKAFNTEHSRNSSRYENLMETDEDDYSTPIRVRKNSDSKRRNQLPEELEQSDKLETIKRLEREKKAVQKKVREEEISKKKKPVVKQKRNSKDLTREYQYGLLDEEVWT